MAEQTALRNNALPYPVYGVPYGVVLPLLDEDGDLVTGGGADTPDSEVSLNGDTFGDCTNELTEIATTSGMYYLLLTAVEMTADIVAIICKVATATTQTTPIVLYPRKLPQIRTGTAQAGAAGTITLDASASAIDDHYNGCLIYLNGGTGSGQARIVTDYAGSTKIASVTPNWATTPDVTSTFIVYLPEGRWVVEANVKAVSDDATAADNLELDYDGTGYAKANSTIGTCTTNTDMRGTDSAFLAASAPANFGDLAITVTTGLVTVGTNNDKTGYALSAGGVDAIWDEVVTGHAIADSFGKVFDDQIDGLRTYGDSGWATATGFSTHAAADVWTVATRVLTANTNLNDPTAAVIADAVWDELSTGHLDAGKAGEQLWTDVDAILVDTAVIGAAGAGLTAIPWNAAWDAEVQSECADALTAYSASTLTAAQVNTEIDTALADVNLDHLVGTTTGIPAVPAGTFLDQIMDDGTAAFDRTTDSLQAVRDRGDAAWITATGFALATVCTEVRLAELDAANLPTDVANVKTDTAAILVDTGTDGVVVASGSKTGYSLAAAGLDSIVIETGLNARQALSITTAGIAGVLAGAATTTVTIAAAGVPATNRITATVDADGNRSVVTLSAPA